MSDEKLPTNIPPERPKVSNKTIQEIYDIVEEAGPEAVKKMKALINHENPKIALAAAKAVAALAAPKVSINETWKKDGERQIDNELFKEFMRFKIQKDLAEEDKRKQTAGKKLELVVSNEGRQKQTQDVQRKDKEVSQ